MKKVFRFVTNLSKILPLFNGGLVIIRARGCALLGGGNTDVVSRVIVREKGEDIKMARGLYAS